MGKKCSEKDCKTQAVFSLNNSIKYYCSKRFSKFILYVL